MSTILEKIILEKKQEVLRLKEKSEQFPKRTQPKHSFLEKLRKANELAIISEFKRASPSKGIINNQIEPAQQAVIYEQAGAAAISVLTDTTFFKGSFSDLAAVRETVTLPILCKDFIIDQVQIDAAIAYGADLILLIVAALEDEQLASLYHYAKSLGLEVLVEVHNHAEAVRAIKLGAELIGVNNRDLKTFQVSLDVTEQLAEMIKKSGAYLISESGIHQQADAERVRNAGANGMLIGEALMTSQNIIEAVKKLSLPLKEGAQQ